MPSSRNEQRGGARIQTRFKYPRELTIRSAVYGPRARGPHLGVCSKCRRSGPLRRDPPQAQGIPSQSLQLLPQNPVHSLAWAVSQLRSGDPGGCQAELGCDPGSDFHFTVRSRLPAQGGVLPEPASPAADSEAGLPALAPVLPCPGPLRRTALTRPPLSVPPQTCSTSRGATSC